MLKAFNLSSTELNRFHYVCGQDFVMMLQTELNPKHPNIHIKLLLIDFDIAEKKNSSLGRSQISRYSFIGQIKTFFTECKNVVV